MSISHWENHTPKANYWSGKAQVLIKPSFQGDLLDMGLVILPPLSKVGIPMATLYDTSLSSTSLSDASLDHGQPLRWSKPSSNSPFRLVGSQQKHHLI